MRAIGITLLAVVLVPSLANAQGDWLQLGGPTRDFRVANGQVADEWPAEGPRELWRRALGEGYSSILVRDHTLITMYREGDREVVVALDAATGRTRWSHGYDAPLQHNGYVDVWLNAAGPGPYSTPLVADGSVFSVGIDGALHALDLETGAEQWSIDLVAEYALEEYNAFASSALALGDTLVLPLGGSAGGVVALDRATGAEVWRSERFAVAPGSPVPLDVDGQAQLVIVGQQELVGIAPDDGRTLWRHPHPNELGLNLSMPVRGPDGLLFISSAYDGGSRVLRLRQSGGDTTVDEVWATNRLRVHFSNAVVVDGVVIGSSGDFGPAFLTAFDLATGEELWRERQFARAHMLLVDGRLLLVDEDGDLALATATRDGLEVQAQAPVLTDNAWTPPTLVGNRLYLRDRQHVVALDVGP